MRSDIPITVSDCQGKSPPVLSFSSDGEFNAVLLEQSTDPESAVLPVQAFYQNVITYDPEKGQITLKTSPDAPPTP